MYRSTTFKMPRSNKKKTSLNKPSTSHPFLEPPPKTIYPNTRSSPSSDTAVQKLLGREKSLMIARAISSAHKHGIQLKLGSANPGLGDCAFEAVVQNNNDRPCFEEKFKMSIDYYRRIWVTDMANRTVNSPWNTLGQQPWLEGWQEMLVPGTYERGIFGDLMLPGIACGIRKILLIFNTNLDSPHDPIYVVDPRQFNINPDTEVPIVLAYNMSHYESMNPCTEADNQLTAILVKEYSEGRYRYGRKDMPFFLDIKVTEDQPSNWIAAKEKRIDSGQDNHFKRMSRARTKSTKNHDKEKDDDEIILEEINNYLDNFLSSLQVT